MKNEDIILIFKKLNLSSNAAKLYLSALELGPSSIQKISKHAGISRMNAYDIVESLSIQGLADQEIKQNGRLIHAKAPSRLIGLLVEKQENLKKLVDKAEIILPELESLYKEDLSRPRIRYFDGLEGIKQVYEDTLIAKTEIVAFSAWHEMTYHLKNYYDSYYLPKRVKRNISIRILSVKTPEAEEYKKRGKQELREQKYVPRQYDFALEINIYNNTVAICSFKDELFGLIIESRQISKALKMMFEIIWTTVKF